jgi:dTDP-4-amino-4,6-dideoxygalactose transaminase
VRPDAALGRDAVLDFLNSRGVGTGVHYVGVHLHPYYRRRYGIDPASLPVATTISERTLSLPLSPGVTEADQDRVVRALEDALIPGTIDARQPPAGAERASR